MTTDIKRYICLMSNLKDKLLDRSDKVNWEIVENLVWTLIKSDSSDDDDHISETLTEMINGEFQLIEENNRKKGVWLVK